jgi:hypothetical protein
MSELRPTNDDLLEGMAKLPKKTSFLYPDDLERGQYICVHSRTDGEYFPGEGLALKVLAMHLPFVVVKPLWNQFHPPWTFNVADYRLIKVSEEFAHAQQAVEPSAAGVPPEMMAALGMPPRPSARGEWEKE